MPQALPRIAVALAAAGTAVTTYSAVRSAEQQAKAAKAESEFRQQEAEATRQSAEFEERQFRRRIAQHLAGVRATTAAAGLVTTSGSPLLSELESTRQAELEALNIRRTGQLSAGGLEFESRLRRFESRAARSSIPLTALSGAFKIGSSVLGQWANRQAPSRTPTVPGI